MNVRALGIFVLIVTLTGDCHAEAQRVVILDGRWTPDYASNACKYAQGWYKTNRASIERVGCEAYPACTETMPTLVACANGDPREQAREFELAIMTEVASASICNGISFANYSGSRATTAAIAKLMGQPHWMLIVDYVPGIQEQSWTLMRGVRAEGEGKATASETAHKVCSIANGRGGKVIH